MLESVGTERLYISRVRRQCEALRCDSYFPG